MKLIIIVEGGLVQDVFCDHSPIECLLIDRDCEEEPSGDDDSVREMTDHEAVEGELKFTAWVTAFDVEVKPDVIEHYFKQYKERG